MKKRLFEKRVKFGSSLEFVTGERVSGGPLCNFRLEMNEI